MGSIGRVLDMVLECIGFTLVMFMLGNGLMGRLMGVEFIPVRMGVDMLGNSSGASSMALVTTISGKFGNGVCGIVYVMIFWVIFLVILMMMMLFPLIVSDFF